MTGVSVVVACHDQEAYVAQCLASLAAQTVAPVEVIVVDDGSTDRSADVATAAADERTEVVRLTRRTGVAAVRNLGVRRARGELVCFVDADDEVDPRWIERLLAGHGDATVTYCDMETFGAQAGPVPGGPFSVERLVRHNFIGVGSLVDRSAFLAVGGFRTLPRLEDWDLWLRLAENGARFSYVPEPLYRWRRHVGASRNTSTAFARYVMPRVIRCRHPRACRWRPGLMLGRVGR